MSLAMLWREPLASVLCQRAVLPESTLEHPAGRHHTDLGAPNLAVCLQGGSSIVVTWLKLHLRRTRGIPTVLPPLCADSSRILNRSAPWEVEG